MRTTIQKWGNSLAVRIPTTFAKDANMVPGTAVEMKLEKGKLIVAPVQEPEYTLYALLKDVTKQNLHRENDFGGPVGRELL